MKSQQMGKLLAEETDAPLLKTQKNGTVFPPRRGSIKKRIWKSIVEFFDKKKNANNSRRYERLVPEHFDQALDDDHSLDIWDNEYIESNATDRDDVPFKSKAMAKADSNQTTEKGSFSRSAVNYMAGCTTAVSNIVMSIVVLLTLELTAPLFKYTPNAVLASIIISAVIGLVDTEAAVLLWRIDKFDFVACMGAFLGVIFKNVEIGLLIAVIIFFAKILLQVIMPRTAVLGRVPKLLSTGTSSNTQEQYRILRWLADEDAQKRENNLPRTQYLIVEMSSVTDIDTSGIHAFEDLYKSLQKREVQLVLANPGTIVMEKLHASKFTNLIGEDKIFLTVADAVATFCPKAEEP